VRACANSFSTASRRSAGRDLASRVMSAPVPDMSSPSTGTLPHRPISASRYRFRVTTWATDVRRHGLGRVLWHERLRRLRARLNPDAPIGMDGVFEMVPFYEAGGFRLLYRDLRFGGVAERLLTSLLSAIRGEIAVLGIPEPNLAALELVRRLGWTQSFGCARMVYGMPSDVSVTRIFGVTSFEFGKALPDELRCADPRARRSGPGSHGVGRMSVNTYPWNATC
jgi:hypothetical protein